MKHIRCIQGSPEWHEARQGRVTASRIKDVLNFLKDGREGSKRADYKTELIAEMLTGQAQPHFVSPAMEWGTEYEPLARAAYEDATGLEVDLAGFIVHPTIDGAGASPDGLINDGVMAKGGVEFKCPNSTTHIEWMGAQVIPEEHRAQMFFNMRCAGRDWWDFVSFDPRLGKRYQLFVRRLEADEAIMDAIDEQVRKFLAEVDAQVSRLNELYPAIEEMRPVLVGGLTDEDFEGLQ